MDTQMPTTGTQKQTEIPAEIRAFLESLLQDAQITTLDGQMHEDMIRELFIRLDNFMMTTIVESLAPEKMVEFTRMSEEGKTRDELEAYLRANIPNATEVFARAMLEFRDLYLGNINTAKSGGNPTEAVVNTQGQSTSNSLAN